MQAERKKIFLGGTILGLAIIVLYFFAPTEHRFYPRCLFHSMTGLSCPGCGTLRAMHQLLHGEFISAFHFNPLFIIALPFLTMLLVADFLPPQFQAFRSNRLRPVWIWVILAILITFGILRNLPAFQWLGPN